MFVQVRPILQVCDGIGNSYPFYKRNENDDKWETFCNDETCFS